MKEKLVKVSSLKVKTWTYGKLSKAEKSIAYFLAFVILFIDFLQILPVLSSRSLKSLSSFGTIGFETVKTSYIIFNDGGIIYARNETRGEIDYFGTDASTIINKVMEALTKERKWKEKVLLRGSFLISDTIKIPSYTVLEIQGKLTLANGTNKRIIENRDRLTTGNTQIEIVGGELNGNRVQQTNGTTLFGILLQKVTDSRIENVQIYNTVNSAIQLYNCERIQVYNISITEPAVLGVAGCLLVDSKDIKIEGGSIISGDDALAIATENADVENIVISNLRLFSHKANGIRINQADSSVERNETRYIRQVTISNIIIDGALGSYSKGIAALLPSTSTSYFEDSSFNNITIRNIHGKDGVYLKNARRITFTNLNVYDIEQNGINMEYMNIEEITIMSFKIRDVAKGRTGHGILLGDPTHQVKKILISDGSLSDATILGSDGIRLRNALNCTIRNVTIKNFTDWGIIEFEPSDYNLIIDNEVRNNKNGGIYIVGPHTIKINNKE